MIFGTRHTDDEGILLHMTTSGETLHVGESLERIKFVSVLVVAQYSYCSVCRTIVLKYRSSGACTLWTISSFTVPDVLLCSIAQLSSPCTIHTFD